MDFWKREMLAILDSDWDSLLKTDMIGIRKNALEINSSFLMFIKTADEFCINDLGYCTERIPIKIPKDQLILERGQKLSESDIISFVKIILKGDINDIEFKRRLIDNLVYKVYISDDNTYIYFNIKGGNNIEDITLEDTETALKNSKYVQTPSDLARQTNPKSNT